MFNIFCTFFSVLFSYQVIRKKQNQSPDPYRKDDNIGTALLLSSFWLDGASVFLFK